MRLSKDQSCVLILTHYFIRADKASAAHQNIRNFLMDRVKKIVYIEHPLQSSKDTTSYLTIYQNGRINYQERISLFKCPQPIAYILHMFITIYFFIKAWSIYDLCFACENLSFISVVVFRYIGAIKRIIYYSVDYTNRRFKNPILNTAYHLIDKIACKLSDVNWVVTHQQINARTTNMNLDHCSPFLVVPMGYMNKDIKVVGIKNVDHNHLVFAGTLIETTGPQLAIKALPKIIKKFPKAHLTIIGSGEYDPYLKNLVKELKVESSVRFIPYISDTIQLSEILTKAAIGLAPYAPIKGSISYFSDPSKIKLYLACGLPVVTTNITTIAQVLKDNGAGLIINFNEDEMYQAVTKLLNKTDYSKYRESALKLSKKYDVRNILDEAIAKII